jgi:carbon-monoxide dehydrogenase medium subunit
MLLSEVAYARPDTLEGALELLAEHDGARALAGGQTLINVLKQRAAALDLLVDLSRLEELRTIGFGAGGALELGAMVTATQLIESSEGQVFRGGILAEVAQTIADQQVRNRGTIGGNVCVNDPTNHLPPLLVALDARFTVRGVAGERVVPADEFFLGVYLTAVAPGELLTRITIPVHQGNGDGFAGVSLGRHGTYIVDVAATAGPATVRVAIGCVDGVPVRATAMERALQGGDLSAEAVKAAAAGLGATIDPPSDVHASAAYRRHLAEVSACRAVLQAAERAKG